MVKVGGHGCGVKVRGMIDGHKVGVSVGGQSRGVNVRGSISGGVVMVRGMRVKVCGVGVRWSVWFIVGEVVDRECSFKELMIECHSNQFHVLPNAGQDRTG